MYRLILIRTFHNFIKFVYEGIIHKQLKIYLILQNLVKFSLGRYNHSSVLNITGRNKVRGTEAYKK